MENDQNNLCNSTMDDFWPYVDTLVWVHVFQEQCTEPYVNFNHLQAYFNSYIYNFNHIHTRVIENVMAECYGPIDEVHINAYP